MAEEKRGDEDEIEEILSDMDAILSGVEPPAAAQEPAPEPLSPSQPPVQPSAAAAQPMRPDVTPQGPQDAAAAAAQPPAPAPPSAAVSALPEAGPLAEAVVPDKAGKDQIRRVAFIYLERYVQERDAFGKALDQAAATIAKRPLFLRTVLLQPVAPEHSPADVLVRIQEAGAVAALALLEGMPEARLKEYGEVLSAGGVMFRLVAPGEALKRSLAVDIVVDMMLLAPES